MIHELIQTDNYLLIVDDSEIKYDDHYIDENKFLYMLKNGSMVKYKSAKKVIAHLPLNNSPIIEGVDLLPPIEDEGEELAKKKYPTHIQPKVRTLAGSRYDVDVNYSERQAYIQGYTKAKEKYKYTEEDLRKVMDAAHGLDLDEIIQSLQQLKMPVGFECEMWYNEFAGKRTIKTTTNSQGLTEWVGKYIY
jgi:hypothetical protein